MAYPKLKIDSDKLKKNVETVVQMAKKSRG